MRSIILAVCLATSAAPPAIRWEPWSNELFTRARAEGRFVLLDLEAEWCHWCHVMEEITYRDETVVRLIGAKYIAVRVDQDSAPELATRYEDYGWPATIVFAPDGSEIVRRRGYMPPKEMASMLQAIIDDPSPGPSVTGGGEPAEPAAITELEARVRDTYDRRFGGWGSVHKFVDPENTEWALESAPALAEETLAKNVALIDPVWGGVYQYSDRRKEDDPWGSPHYEKIMWFQAQDLRLYALAYAQTKKPIYLEHARAIDKYLAGFLTAPNGAFYTSQDADPPGGASDAYFRLGDADRRKLGVPRIDTHIYPRENGWAIAALAAYADATGDAAVLARAVRAADAIGSGELRAGSKRPYLCDSLAMARAQLSLYASTADRRRLDGAIAAAAFIDRTFKDPRGGFMTAVPEAGASGVHRDPVRQLDENVELARFANLLARYSGAKDHRAIADHALRWLESPEVLSKRRSFGGLLTAKAELGRDPLHVVIVGAVNDARAQSLFDAARALPGAYKRIERWDPAGPKLLSQDVEYPVFDKPAAFACDRGSCSRPVFEPAELAAVAKKLRAF